jgi:uncharacterized protein (DUF1800 family)
MTERERISHLLRRFGFGAGQAELARYEPLGAKGTLDKLLNYEDTYEGFTVPPWQFVFQRNAKGEVTESLDPNVFTSWWTLRMVMTQRPLQHKLGLFYSNLFVAGADKVSFGPMMLDYLETILENTGNDFHEVLSEVSKTPAMLRYLDGDHNLRGKPNENFGREVMELFTLGIGNYTEKDVKESARAFTGWWYRSLIDENDGRPYAERVTEFIKLGLPMAAMAWMPDVHDPSPKTVLGRTAPYTGEQLIEVLSAEPATARRIGSRLWEYFAYANPSDKVRDHMGSAFKKHKGNARQVLREMTTMNEFWGTDSVRRLVKSPVDFVVPILRQMNLRDEMGMLQGSNDPTEPVDIEMRRIGDTTAYWMDVMGLRPLHPPSVKGFDWGDAFINTNSMIKRIEFSGIFYNTLAKEHLGDRMRMMVMATNPKDEVAAVHAMMAVLDGELSDDKVAILAKRMQKVGGMKTLNQKRGVGPLVEASKLLFGTPEFQFC